MKADKRIGLLDKNKSGIFYECFRILQEVKPKYFLMENVIMPKDQADEISKLLGVKPIRINSSVITGQLRDRLYWTNIKNVTIPQMKNITAQDMLDSGYTPRNKLLCLMRNDGHGGYYNGSGINKTKSFYRSYYRKFTNVIFESKEHFELCKKKSEEIIGNEKPTAKLFDGCNDEPFNRIRFLTKFERAKAQTVPTEYIKCLNEKDAADVLGDGWTVDVIAHILSFIK